MVVVFNFSISIQEKPVQFHEAGPSTSSTATIAYTNMEKYKLCILLSEQEYKTGEAESAYKNLLNFGLQRVNENAKNCFTK